jgi:hypothetical protein
MSDAMSKSCKLCFSEALNIELSLNDQCVSHHFTTDEEVKTHTQHLEVGQCGNCGLVQTTSPFPVDELTPNYSWITCTEPEGHLDALVADLRTFKEVDSSSSIVGLSFKEETTLARFNALNYSNTRILNPLNDFEIENANSKIELVQHRFTHERANKLREKYGEARIFIARHILEHAYNLVDFVSASLALVAVGGYVVFEIPDCETGLVNGDPTILWEEHTVCFTEATFKRLFEVMGLTIVYFKKIHYKYENAFVAVIEKQSENTLMKQPHHFGDVKNDMELYQAFVRRFDQNKKKIIDTLISWQALGKKVAFIGAGHMANSFINYYDIGKYIDFVIDDNEQMQNLHMPRCKNKIVSSKCIKAGLVDIILSSISELGEKKLKEKHGAYLDELDFMSIYSQDRDSIYRYVYLQHEKLEG